MQIIVFRNIQLSDDLFPVRGSFQGPSRHLKGKAAGWLLPVSGTMGCALMSRVISQ